MRFDVDHVRARVYLISGSLAALACGEPSAGEPATTDGESSSSEAPEPSTTTTTGGSASTSAATSESSESTAADESTGPTPSACGNGVIETDEVCDNGAANGSYGACASDCSGLGPHCGDAEITDAETCDDGNTVNGDGCNCLPSGELLWAYVGDVDTSFRGVAVGVDQGVLGVGTSGDAWDFGSAQALTRTFSADGMLIAADDSIVAGESYFLDAAAGDDGRWWLFGSRPPTGWLFRITDGEVDQRSYSLDDLARGVLAPSGTAVASYQAVGWLDADDLLAWQAPFGWVDDVAYAPDDTVLALVAAGYSDPREVVRFDLAGNQVGEAVPIPDITDGSLAIIEGGVVVTGYDDFEVAPELGPFVGITRAYDETWTELWSHESASTQWLRVEADAAGIVLAGGVLGSEALEPAMTRLGLDGSVVLELVVPPLDYDLQGGLFEGIAFGNDGSIHLAGFLGDVEADPFEPPSYAFMVKLVP